MIPLSIEWKTRRIEERVGSHLLQMEVLADLEKTIDDLFLVLEKSGRTELLESLCPYFGQVWPSARALSQHLSANPIEKDGAVRVLEVGCGLALPSIFLAKSLKYSKIFASDFHPEVERFLHRNLLLNQIGLDQISYFEMDWKKSSPESLGMERFHVVMGSDILYEKQHPEEVAESLCSWVKPSGRILVADPARPYLQVFVDEMKARGWGTAPQVLAVPDGHEGSKETYVLDFRKI